MQVLRYWLRCKNVPMLQPAGPVRAGATAEAIFMLDFGSRRINFPDYILGMSKTIWEDRGRGTPLREFYAPDVIVRMPSGTSQGEPAATEAVMSALVEFPECIPLGEDVIWTGDGERGFFGSHRTVSRARHLGDGVFGPASGKRVMFRSITESYLQGGQITEEWRVCDNGAILRQLGYDLKDWARWHVENGARAGASDDAVKGPYAGWGNDSPWGEAYEDILRRVMASEFSTIPAQYDRACQLSHPGGVVGHGWSAATGFWTALRAAFPDASFAVRHRMGNGDSLLAPRGALRWTLTGTHSGWGDYGPPSGAPVHIMGLSHAEFGSRGLQREWVLFDEAAVWMQILAHTG